MSKHSGRLPPECNRHHEGLHRSVHQAGKPREVFDNKFPLLGTSGMAGIGKTTMLLYGLHQLVGTGAKGVYLSFNGNGTANSNVFAGSKAGDVRIDCL